jgi:hypothetical protein
MSPEQLKQYDLFLDENDWDIYYWATQEPPEEGVEVQKEDIQKNPSPGEWAQTVGTFKAAYRPVPQRWKDSEVLRMLRDHVKSNEEGLAFMPRLKSFN